MASLLATWAEASGYTSFSVNVPIHTALSRMLLACAVPRTQLSLHAPIGMIKLELILQEW